MIKPATKNLTVILIMLSCSLFSLQLYANSSNSIISDKIDILIQLSKQKMESEKSFKHLVFIGQYGSVVQFDRDFNLKHYKKHFVPYWGRGGIETTTISPDRSRIFIGTQGKDSPLEVLEMPALELLDQPDMVYPEVKLPFYTYWPVELIAVNNHQIYISDESFSVQEPPFGTVLVNLEKSSVEKTNNSIRQQNQCDVSPDGKYLISDSSYRIQFIDLATDKALWTIKHGEGYGLEAYRHIYERKIDWTSNTMEVIWSRFLKGNERIFEHVTIDLKTQKMKIVTTKEPWISQHYGKETFFGNFLKVYVRNGKFLMDESLRAIKAKLTPEIIKLLPEKPTHVYISPKGEYLLVNGYTFNDGDKFHTGWVIIDMKKGKTIEHDLAGGLKDFDEYLVGVYFTN